MSIENLSTSNRDVQSRYPSFELADFDPPPKHIPYSTNSSIKTSYPQSSNSKLPGRSSRSTPATPASMSTSPKLSVAYNNNNNNNNSSSQTSNYFSSNSSESTAKLNKSYGDFLTITPRRKGKQQRHHSDNNSSSNIVQRTFATPTTSYELRSSMGSSYNDSTLCNSETLRIGGSVVRSKLVNSTTSSTSNKESKIIDHHLHVSPPNAFSDISESNKFTVSTKSRITKIPTDFTIAV